jgi:hypothetical protein
MNAISAVSVKNAEEAATNSTYKEALKAAI